MNEKIYEVELEIADVNHIKDFAVKGDKLNFKKKVRKFLLNQICISNIVMNEVMKVKKSFKK